MGYYAYPTSHLMLKDLSKSKEVEKKLEELSEKGGPLSNAAHNNGWNRYAEGSRMYVRQQLAFVETTGGDDPKYCEEEVHDFLNLLLPYLDPDSFIEFRGEDVHCFKFVIRGNEWEELNAEIVYDAYEHFLEIHGKALPKKLKEDLEKWRMTTKI